MSLQHRAKAALELRRRKAAQSADDPRRVFVERYYNDPQRFIGECIAIPDGLAFYQNEICDAVAKRRRVAVRGPHGLGKTAVAACIILWFALTREANGDDWKAPTTASVWRQLDKFLWPEVAKWARCIRWNVIGWRGPLKEHAELLDLSIKLEHGEAFAIASDKSELIEGAHASQLLYIFDEAKIIPDQTWDSAEGAFASGECYWLAISTPGDPQGRFYNIHQRAAGYDDWFVRHVTLEEAVAAGRVSSEWAEARKQQWGEGSAVYQNRVLGQFAANQTQGIIPLSWVERANENWRAWKDSPGYPGKFTGVGVDVGGGTGGDKIALALCYSGMKISEIRSGAFAIDPSITTMEIVGRVGALLGKGGVAVVDVIGIGAGVHHRLTELGYHSIPFNAAQGTGFTDKSGELGFENWRAAGWWLLRELLDPQSGVDICLPPDDDLIGDLTAPRVKRINSYGKMIVEGKDEIRKRIGRSTDCADSVIQIIVGPHLWKESNAESEHQRIVYAPGGTRNGR